MAYSVQVFDRFGQELSRAPFDQKADAAAAFRKATVAVRATGDAADGGEVRIYNGDRLEVCTFWQGVDSRAPGVERTLWATVEPVPGTIDTVCRILQL